LTHFREILEKGVDIIDIIMLTFYLTNNKQVIKNEKTGNSKSLKVGVFSKIRPK